MITADVEGLFRELGALPAVLAADLALASEEAAREARTLSPVRSGRLRATVSNTRPDANSFVLSAATPYASFVLLGTRRQRAFPFLQIAAARQLRAFDTRLRQQLGVD